MMVTFIRICGAGLRNFLRNAWLSTAATAVMTVTLTIILSSFIATNALNATIKSIVEKIDVSIYLKDGITEEQVKDLQDRLARVENVASVKYISKLDALKRYREQNKSNKKLLEAVTEDDNPLPASLEIKAKDPKKLEPITEVVNQRDVKPLVSEFSYEGDRKATIDRIVRASNFIKTTGLVSSLIFIIISVLIIFNTIRMAIFTRREEIEIMKLVGATGWFIRGPFIFEAALYGIIAAGLAVFMCYSLVLAGGPKMAAYVDVNQVIALFKERPVLVIVSELVIGVIIGTSSSLLAMARYLKL
jgi:cell division transport system permease protein